MGEEIEKDSFMKFYTYSTKRNINTKIRTNPRGEKHVHSYKILQHK
jgi:hypothetical protein